MSEGESELELTSGEHRGIEKNPSVYVGGF
jgi:hypothetical protein